MAFLVERSLFSDNPNLHNIDTGIAADVKASNAKTVIKYYGDENVFCDIPLKEYIYNFNSLE